MNWTAQLPSEPDLEETAPPSRRAYLVRASIYLALALVLLASAYASRVTIYNALYGPFEVERLELIDAQSTSDLGLRRWFIIRGDAAVHSGWQLIHFQKEAFARLHLEKPQNYYLVSLGRRTLIVESSREAAGTEFIGHLRPLPEGLRRLLDEQATEEEKMFRLPYLLQEAEHGSKPVFLLWGSASVLHLAFIALALQSLRRAIAIDPKDVPSVADAMSGGVARNPTKRPRE